MNLENLNQKSKNCKIFDTFFVFIFNSLCVFLHLDLDVSVYVYVYIAKLM